MRVRELEIHCTTSSIYLRKISIGKQRAACTIKNSARLTSILLSSGLDWIVQLLLGAWGQGQASWAMQEFPRAGTVTSVSAVSTI